VSPGRRSTRVAESSSSVLWARGGVRLMAGAFCGLEPGACFAGIVASRGVDRGTPCERDATWTGSARVESRAATTQTPQSGDFPSSHFAIPPAGPTVNAGPICCGNIRIRCAATRE